MNEWYDLSDDERIKNFYSKYSIKDFWDFWGGDVMEVRIKDFPLIKQIKERFGYPISASGVYVSSSIELKNVIAFARDRVNLWFGINPKKKHFDNRGFLNYSGKDYGIKSLNYIFIDIDPDVKNEKRDFYLKNAYILANKIVEKLGDFAKKYFIVCSAYGVQIGIPLDVPIMLPELVFDKVSNSYIDNEDFERIKNIIKDGVFKDIVKFGKTFNNELGVSVDKSAGNMGRVCALPFTYNFKYDNKIPRGIIVLKNDGENYGLTHYILSKADDPLEYKRKSMFGIKKKVDSDLLIKPGELEQHRIVKFILDNELPIGMVNNYLWFSLKCLIRDSGLDFGGKEFSRVHSLIEKKLRGKLPSNIPEPRFSFDPNVVNYYCIMNMFKPLYSFRSGKKDLTKYYALSGKKIDWSLYKRVDDVLSLNKEGDIFEDIKYLKCNLLEDNVNNINIISAFINGLVEKYGIEKAKYYVDNVLNYYVRKE